MKILPLEQGTNEWKEFRRTHIGASDIGTIMEGTEGEKYQLYEEKVMGKEKFVTESMARGSLMEEEAILWLMGKRLKITRPVVQKYTCDWLFASLDCYHAGQKMIVEIKCPGFVPDTCEEYPRYMRAWWQIQAQLFCTGLDQATLLIYSPLKQCRKIIHRDDESISLLLEKGHEFYERVVYRNPPPIPESLPIREDEAANNWAICYADHVAAQKALDEQVKLLRDEGIYMANESSFECRGVKVQKIPSKEVIDYEAACKFHGIDATPFKKKPKVPYTWRLTIPRELGEGSD